MVNYDQTASNFSKKILLPFRIIFTVATNITNSSFPQVVTSPSMATFTCTPSSLPTPNITWINSDGIFLTSDTNNIMITHTVMNRQATSTLRISSTSPTVSGTFYCNASNEVSVPEMVMSVPALFIGGQALVITLIPFI